MMTPSDLPLSPPTEAHYRAAIIEEAKTWLMTRWHHGARIKGAGVDCGLFVASVYNAVGLLSWSVFGPEGERDPSYEQDWMMHRDEERFLGAIGLFADPVDRPLPGDIAAWKYGLCFSHAAIVIDWPQIIHAHRSERAVVYGDATKGALAREHLKDGGSAPREVRFYSRFARLAADALTAERNAHRETTP